MKTYSWILILVLVASCQNFRFQDFSKRKYCDLKKVRVEKKEVALPVIEELEVTEIEQEEANRFEVHSTIPENKSEVTDRTIREDLTTELKEKRFEKESIEFTKKIPILSQSKLQHPLRKTNAASPEKAGKVAGVLFWISAGMSIACIVLFALAISQFSIILLMSSLTAGVFAIVFGYLTQRKLNQVPEEKRTKGQMAQRILLALTVGLPACIITLMGVYGLIVLLIS